MAASKAKGPDKRGEGSVREVVDANKGGVHGIGAGMQRANENNNDAMQSAFAKHNAKGETQPEGHVPFQTPPKP